MPNGEPLEETVRREAEKAPARAAARGNFLDDYFSLLGNQFITTGKILKTAAKFTFHTVKLGLALGAGYALAGLDAIALSGGFMLGNVGAKIKNKEKITYGEVTNRGVAGAIVGIPMHYLFGWVVKAGNYIGSAVGSKLVGGISKAVLNLSTYPPFIWTDEHTMHFLDKKHEVHRGKDFWKYNAELAFKKKLWLITGPNAAITPLQYQIPVGGGISALYSYLSAKPKEKKEEKQEVLRPAPQGYHVPPGYALQPAR